ncbi:MAG TPA: recombination mediator RecR [Phycisphaerae bacterium]|nr:recombination mediator RecR [Phycisphaerae bacterium]
MDAYPESMERLMEALGKLPGIGRRTAERLAFYLLEASDDEVAAMVQALGDIKSRIRLCDECGALADGPRCALCDNPRRDHSRLCVVERPRDVIRIEAAGGYNGLYHVLGGLLAPMENVGPDRLDLKRLERRIAAGEIREVILAFSPTAEGDGTALCVADRLKATGVRLTRLARGLPTGATLDYANPAMLADALRQRQQMES